jgi:hypothetical protein
VTSTTSTTSILKRSLVPRRRQSQAKAGARHVASLHRQCAVQMLGETSS